MAIHREKYTNYDGVLDDSGAWWVVAWQTIKNVVGLLRTKIIVPLLWIAPLVATVAVVGEYAVRGKAEGFQAPGGSAVVVFLQVQFYLIAILFMACCSGVVSHDLRYNTTQLYFSKPLEKWEYTLGKFLGLFLLGSLVTVAPAIGVGGIRAALLSQYGFFSAVAVDSAIGVGVSVVMTAIASIVMLGLSSATERTGFVVLAWIGVLFVPYIGSVLVSLSVDNPDVAGLLSIQSNIEMLSSVAIEGAQLEIPIWSPVVALVAFAGGGYWLHRWRLDHLEGV